MKRRVFLQSAATAAILPLRAAAGFAGDQPSESRVVTVTGEVPADQLGQMLPHEHILVDFIGADKVSRDRYDADEAYRVMLPYVRQAKDAGCDTMAECTPNFLGRDPVLLKRLSDATGMKILTNTGLYGARQGKFLPKYAFDENSEQLAKRWIAEWKDGIGETGIRPGFIKIGVDAGELTDVNRKLVEAAARCHRETGLTIAGHTGDGQAALAQVQILTQAGVSPGAWIWVHAQNEKDANIHRQVARAGAWVEFDGIRPNSIDRHVELVQNLRDAGLLNRVLLSHDAGWYSVGEPNGGQVRSFETLFTKFVPALKDAGFSAAEIQQLIVTNPARAFAFVAKSD